MHHFFYEMLEELNLSDIYNKKGANLSDALLEGRRDYLTGILRNCNEYEANDIKEVICDLYFHDKKAHLCLDRKEKLNPILSLDADIVEFLYKSKTIDDLDYYV